MGFLKRAITSISRNLGKTMILLILVFVLGSVIAGAISVQRAVANTETNLRRGMRPIVNLEFDVFAFMEQSEDWNVRATRVSAETIRMIGSLPYVNYYNYSVEVWLQCFDFKRYTPEMAGHEHVDWSVGTVMEDWPNEVFLTGVSRPDIIYIEQSAAELVAGRTFTDEEMMASGNLEQIPIVISRPLADANNLYLNGTFTLANITLRTDASGMARPWSESEIFAQFDYTFEIIGLFDLPNRRTNLVADNNDDQVEFTMQDTDLNRQYVPVWVVEKMNRQGALSIYEMMSEGGFVLPGWEDFDQETDLDVNNYADALFILEDPLDIDAFRAQVEPLIPTYYHVRDLSGNFEEIGASMETMSWIADLVLNAAVVATILTLTLIIALFLRDRRYEMGIYLALGEKKGRILLQVIFEITATALIGMTFALFVGNIVSTRITQTMLRQELTREREPEPSTGIYGIWTYFERLNWDIEVSPDEMMDAFDVTLDAQAIVIFYGIGMLIIIVSTLAPVIYLMRLNPKKILMEAKSS